MKNDRTVRNQIKMAVVVMSENGVKHFDARLAARTLTSSVCKRPVEMYLRLRETRARLIQLKA